MIYIKGDYSGIERDLNHLDHQPDSKMKKLLDTVLTAGYVGTQELVHIRTGSLKSSGKEKTSSGKRQWQGEIRYGGPSAGINNPVRYAIYEKARGGAHDFMHNLTLTHSEFVEAIKEGMHS